MLQRLALRATPKATKQAARYTPAGGAERCGQCRHFAAPSACSRILGPVSASGWCMLFSRQVTAPHHAGQQTVLGGAAGASLDLSFMSSGTLPSGVVFTRASTATYFDATGTLRTAAINAPRWDYDPATHALLGLLIEEARTNIALQSANISTWTVFGASSPTVTANNVVSPDGTTTGTRMVIPAVSAGASGLVYYAVALSAATYTFSVWLRGNAGGEQTYLGGSTGGTTFVSSPRLTLTTAWQRYAFTFTGTAAAWVVDIGTDLRDVAQTATSASTIYAWGAQIELATFATSYIPTTTVAVTRAQEVMSMPVGAWFNATAGTLSLEVRYNGSTVASFPMLASLDDGSTNNQVVMLGKLTGLLHCEGSVSGVNQWAIPGPFAPDPGVIRKPGVSMALNNINYDINGVAGTPDTVATLPAVTQLHLGCNQLGATGAHSVAFRRVRYWPRALSASELQSVTT